MGYYHCAHSHLMESFLESRCLIQSFVEFLFTLSGIYKDCGDGNRLSHSLIHGPW